MKNHRFWVNEVQGEKSQSFQSETRKWHFRLANTFESLNLQYQLENLEL